MKEQFGKKSRERLLNVSFPMARVNLLVPEGSLRGKGDLFCSIPYIGLALVISWARNKILPG
ncbi:hypothetical protein DDZ15_03350 [Rhodohalobacter mucosus]|uniref:Uncharacterized protein n=1 Tax=Rhodohalobacter mucosus TaxID=2079485 RepID=A0A316TRU0_9BACT|nr:hypothetical protein DDZ15_03350 [Rhodohalobacter mucosus]